MGIKRIIKQATTDEADQHDIFLWCFVTGFIGILVLTGFAVHQGKPPTLTEFSESIAWLLGGGGGGYCIKRIGEKYGDGPAVPQ